MMFVEPAIHKITPDEYQETIATISCSIVAAIPDKAGLDNNLIMDMVLEGAGLFLYSRLAPGSEIEGVEIDLAAIRKELSDWANRLVESVDGFMESEETFEEQVLKEQIMKERMCNEKPSADQLRELHAVFDSLDSTATEKLWHTNLRLALERADTTELRQMEERIQRERLEMASREECK